MRLNTIKSGPGAKQSPTRLGRGIGSGMGKTCGRGHKGQRARAGGFHKLGFEGGQMPLQRRLPKFGFNSAMASNISEVRLDKLEDLEAKEITLDILKDANIIRKDMLRAKVILSGKITKAVSLKGIAATKGAKAAIEKVGGKIN